MIDARDLVSPRAGLVRQRLCFAFQLETTDYYRLVAVLMAQVRARDASRNCPQKRQDLLSYANRLTTTRAVLAPASAPPFQMKRKG